MTDHPKADNWIDIAGYAACAAEIATEGRRRNAEKICGTREI